MRSYSAHWCSLWGEISKQTFLWEPRFLKEHFHHTGVSFPDLDVSDTGDGLKGQTNATSHGSSLQKLQCHHQSGTQYSSVPMTAESNLLGCLLCKQHTLNTFSRIGYNGRDIQKSFKVTSKTPDSAISSLKALICKLPFFPKHISERPAKIKTQSKDNFFII